MNKNINFKNFFVLITISIFATLLVIRIQGLSLNTLPFWIYGIFMTIYLIALYGTTVKYKPMADTGYRPSVSIIIPVKNEEQVISRTLECAINIDYPKEFFEVIVVNDGSTDKTLERIKDVKSDKITIVNHEKNAGKREALASGIAVAKGEIVVCIDSDSFVEKNAITLLMQPFIDQKVVAVCGHGIIENKNRNLLTKMQSAWYQEMFRLTKGMESVFNCVTCCCGILSAYRTKAAKSVMHEWLNERFLGNKILIGDDRQLTSLVSRGTGTDYSARETRIVYQSNAVVTTIAPENIKTFWKQQLRWKRAWVHASALAGRFMYKKRFPFSILWYMYQFLAYMSPVIVIYGLFVVPILRNDLFLALFFPAACVFVGLIHGINVWQMGAGTPKQVFYRVLLVFLSTTMTISVLLYAWLTFWKGGWVTRSDQKINTHLPQTARVTKHGKF
jgi:hyaluronan synthase